MKYGCADGCRAKHEPRHSHLLPPARSVEKERPRCQKTTDHPALVSGAAGRTEPAVIAHSAPDQARNAGIRRLRQAVPQKVISFSVLYEPPSVDIPIPGSLLRKGVLPLPVMIEAFRKDPDPFTAGDRDMHGAGVFPPFSFGKTDPFI